MKEFILAAPPYPDASARVDKTLAEFRQRCRRPRYGPRLSAYERAYIGRCDEHAAVLAERYQVSRKYVHDLRRRAREEDG